MDDNLKLKSDFSPLHSLCILIQKTDGEIHMARISANDQAILKNEIFRYFNGELETYGEFELGHLKYFFEADFDEQNNG